ncbi:MAG: hypothetical protein HY928_06715 [Elusimicrobia bacterium]|nr:hypothetical protein [Elusimicrobiota bacterium]
MRTDAANRLPEPTAGETAAAPAARRETGSFLARMRDRALAVVVGRTRSALLALGLAAAGAGVARAEDAARIEAPTAAGAKVELVAAPAAETAPTLLLARADTAPVAGDGRVAGGRGGEARETAPYVQEAERETETVLARLEARYSDDEMRKVLADLRARPGSLAQGVRDTLRTMDKAYHPDTIAKFREAGKAVDVCFYDRLLERPGDLMDPMDRPAPDGLPELAAPVADLFPNRLYPVTEANLGEFLDWTANKIRFTKPVLIARCDRGDWAYVDATGEPDKASINAIRRDQIVATKGGKDSRGMEKTGYEKRLRADPRALAAYLAAINKSVGAVREKGGSLPVNWPGKLAFHLGTAALVGSGAVDAGKMTDADLFQLSDEFGFLAQAAAAPGSRHPVAVLAFVDRPDASMVKDLVAAVGPEAEIAKDAVRSTLPVGSEPGSPLHVRYQAQFAWENAPALLSAAAARGPEHRLAASKALRQVAGQARMVAAYMGELDRATAEAYGLSWTPALEAAAKAAPRGALRHVAANLRASKEDLDGWGSTNRVVALNEHGKVLEKAFYAWRDASANQKAARAAELLAIAKEERMIIMELQPGDYTKEEVGRMLAVLEKMERKVNGS